AAGERGPPVTALTAARGEKAGGGGGVTGHLCPPQRFKTLKGRCPVPESNLHQLSALGQSAWLDFLSREILETGKLEQMMREDAIVGVTSNPTIFQKAISEGKRYDEQLREIMEGGEED